ncbi:peptidoglycan editing factor PgeF [Gammaproteobacteria bacterium]|nr:peptidoglycan editing factor PgeF [Gammaproteobacteria bacterium]
MLQTHDYVEPDFNLGKDVRCLMLTKEFLENKTSGSINFLRKITRTPVQLMEQVHGVNIKTISTYLSEPVKKTDGIFTKSKDFALAVKTADCIPLALSSEDGSEIALLHVGWKGLCGGIIENFLTKYSVERKKYNAWIGPCISADNYEVGKEVFDSFCKSDPIAEINFKALEKNKWKFDLRSEAARRLSDGNVNICTSEHCTFKEEELYYSYRNNQSDRRMITLIWRNYEE